MDEPRVYISYTRPVSLTAEWLRRFSDALRRRGYEVFDAREAFAVQPLAEADETVRRALLDSDVVVVLLDAADVGSPAFYFDYGASMGLGKPAIALVADDVEPSSLPAGWGELQLIQCRSPEDAAERLAAAVPQALPA